MTSKVILVTEEFQLNFENLFTPKPYFGGEPRYTMAAMFDKNKHDMSDIKKAINSVKIKEFGEDIPKKLNNLITDGDESDNASFKGCWVMNPNAPSTSRPKLLNEKRKEITSRAELYSGCYIRALIEIVCWNYKKEGSALITEMGCYVKGVQKMRDGKPLYETEVDVMEYFGDVEIKKEDNDLQAFMGA